MKDALTILFPTGSFYPAQNGGPDNTVYWITKALKRRGHHPIVTTTTSGLPAGTPVNTWLDKDCGEVIYTRNAIHYLPLRLLFTALRSVRRADVLHFTMISYPIGILLAVANSWWFGKPMLWSSRGDLDPPILRRSRRKKLAVIWLIRHLVARRKLWFHSTCDAETAYLKDHFGRDARVIQIPNYMELPDYLDAPKEQYLLYVGRIDPKKAIENLIDAVAGSDAFRASAFTLKIVGDYDNAYGRSLHDQVREADLMDKVLFLGHRAGNEKERLLASAWCLFMPSHSENFGIVVLEAMAQGTPAVASLGTPWECLKTQGAGFWVSNSPATLRATVEKVIALPEASVSAMGRRALSLARERFDVHANAAEWTDTYRRMLADDRNLSTQYQ